MQFRSRLAEVEAILLGSFDVREAARVASAQPCSSRECVAIHADGSVRHERRR